MLSIMETLFLNDNIFVLIFTIPEQRTYTLILINAVYYIGQYMSLADLLI